MKFSLYAQSELKINEIHIWSGEGRVVGNIPNADSCVFGGFSVFPIKIKCLLSIYQSILDVVQAGRLPPFCPSSRNLISLCLTVGQSLISLASSVNGTFSNI